jgi:transposase
MEQITTVTAGIDTSKAKLDIAVLGRADGLTVENSQPGWKRLAAQLTKLSVTRIGIEATGGYERGVTRYLQQAGFSVSVLQPLQVRSFARMRLKRAKNDRIDALLIAACTELIDGGERVAHDPRFDALANHLTFIEQIEEDLSRIRIRLEHILDARLRRIANADIARLEKRHNAELKRLTAELQAHPDLATRYQLVLSVPGIGPRTALAIVVRMPEIGKVSREEAASLAGLAPFVQQSGKHVGETHIGGGRDRLRRSLYHAALAASFRWNPALVALYQRLIQRGKSHKSALVACARKLLIYANTVVQRGTPWLKNPAPNEGAS